MSFLSAVYHFSKLATVVLTVTNLSACAIPDLKDYADRVVRAGLTVEEMKKARGANLGDWDKPAYHRPNGNAVYVESVGAKYKGCDFHWEVNPQGRVIGYKTVGDRCW